MIDITKLTAEELMRGKTAKNGYEWFSAETFEEILRRLARLEKCEAALKQLAVITEEDCSCLPAFKERRLIDPACSYHDYKWAIDAARAALEGNNVPSR